VDEAIFEAIVKAMNVITPPGVSQATALDYLLTQPVTLEGVFIT
jgi:hypothetical protein